MIAGKPFNESALKYMPVANCTFCMHGHQLFLPYRHRIFASLFWILLFSDGVNDKVSRLACFTAMSTGVFHNIKINPSSNAM